MVRQRVEQIEFKGEDLICEVCGQHFYVSASEQLRWKQMGLQTPHRCSECRKKGRRTRITHDKPEVSDLEFDRIMKAARSEICR